MNVLPQAADLQALPTAASEAAPEDTRQALRLRRFYMAAATALFVPVALGFTYWIGKMELAAALRCSALVFGLIGLFYGLIRSGLNLRFADPSLTAEMIGTSILMLGWIMYEAPSLRDSLILFYAVTLLFGVFRLATRRLMGLALLALAVHACVLGFSYLRDPQLDPHMAAIQFSVLAGVLPWFALMGGYVSQLRRQVSDSNRQLKTAYGRIENFAIRDELTGLYNRRFLLEVLARECSRARRLGTAFSVCLFDLDFFKAVNDTLGHAAGDSVLKHFARLGSSELRAVDVFGRYGGEEFLLILPDTGQQGACASAERVRAAFEIACVPQLPADRRFTVTGGIATGGPQEDVEALLARADSALYEGKAAGRNRVVAVG